MSEPMPVERVRIDSLVLDPRNPRRGKVKSLMAALEEFGQHRPAVVQRNTNKVIIGNHMIKAAQALGWDDIDITWVDDDHRKATRRGLADNAASDHADYDRDLLDQLIEEVGAVPGMEDRDGGSGKGGGGDDLLDAQLPLTPHPGEGYSYVLIVATTAMDVAWLETTFALDHTRSYKSNRVGPCRVITVDQARNHLNQE